MIKKTKKRTVRQAIPFSYSERIRLCFVSCEKVENASLLTLCRMAKAIGFILAFTIGLGMPDYADAAGVHRQLDFADSLSPLEAIPPAAADGSRFTITRYTIDGNTLLKPTAIDALLQPYTGTKKSLATVKQAASVLQEAYQHAGYSTVKVSVPTQTLEQDSVVLKVHEATIRTVTFEPGAFHDAANLAFSLPALKQGQTPNMTAITTELQIANENPAKQTDVVLVPSTDGAVVQAKVKTSDEKPWKLVLDADNTGDHSTGMFRVGGAAQYANLFNRDQVLTAQYITSPDHVDAVKIFGLGYRIPLYSLNGVVDVVGGYSEVNDGKLNDLFNVSGKGTVVGVKYAQYLPRSANFTQKIVAGIDYRAYDSTVVLDGTTNSLIPSITIHPFSISYVGEWQRDSHSLSFYLGSYHNAFGDGDRTAFKEIRSGAPADYTFINGGIDYRRSLVQDWQLRLAANGQYSFNPLIPQEQFGIGGAQSVRGLYERAVLGDSGYFATIELYAPDVASLAKWNKVQVRPLVFFDEGTVSRTNVLVGEQSHDTEASIGGGLRFSYGSNVNLRLDAAHVLIREPSTLDSKIVHGALEISY